MVWNRVSFLVIITHECAVHVELSTYVCAYNVHEIAVSRARKVRRVYEWSADIL